MIDIGANEGSWSLEIAEVFPKVASLMVEPNEELMPKLEALWLVRCSRRCWMQDRNAQILRRQRHGQFVICRSSWRCKPQWVEEYMPSQSLDLIKIDAEGLELEIINEGEDIIRSAQIVMLEVPLFQYTQDRPTFAQLVSKMDGLGFSVYDFSMFYRRPSDSALGLMDCVFVANSSPLRKSQAL